MAKIPKKIIICGGVWDVKIDPKVAGGSFSGKNKEMTIGGKNKKHIFDVFLHEVIEAVLTMRGHRYDMYWDSTNDRKLFSFYHHEFENLVADVSLALRDCWRDNASS